MSLETDAIKRLKEGNRRFVEGKPRTDAIRDIADDRYSATEQSPFAIILGCSDSRVPPEILFDQGIADLFVIRIAGNVVTPEVIGSIEFAATKFGPRLVVVLGHAYCGAVQATYETIIADEDRSLTPDLRSIVDRIEGSVRESIAALPDGGATDVVNHAIHANECHSVCALKQGSEVLAQLARDEGLQIVGAHYDLDTGRVHFHDE